MKRHRYKEKTRQDVNGTGFAGVSSSNQVGED